jgi:D-aminopeptidase
VFLTSTMQLGRVYDAACELLMEEEPTIGVEDVIIPIVAECDDSFLNDARRMQVSFEDVRAALRAARASAGGPPPPEGAVGAGTGMSCLGFKGGIGTASRIVPSGHVVGVLVLSNFGERERLTVDGVPVGRLLPTNAGVRDAPPGGSCIVVIVTDAPLDSAACARLARRAGLGLARTGSTASHGSGEIFLALATGLREQRSQAPPSELRLAGSELNPFFAAVVEATEEAVLNSLLAAPSVTGRDGNTSEGLPADPIRELLRAARVA